MTTVKVIHVIAGLKKVGGAELMLKRLIETQNGGSEFEHSIISLSDLGEFGQGLIEAGISVDVLGMTSMRDMPRVLLRLIGIFRERRPDIVQTWMYHSDLLGGLAARMAGIGGIIWGVRTTDLQEGGKSTTVLVRKVCAWLSGFLPKYIVCAAEASRRSHIAVGYNASRMLVIPNGFDLTRLQATDEQRSAIRSGAGIEASDIVIGSLGRFHPVKDHASFVAAAGLLAPRYSRLKFLLVGRELLSSNAELQRLIEATGYAERFILLGERQDVASCLKAMDIFCLHSRTEGFPNVLGEAMAMGLPCDAAYLLGNDGVVVPALDPNALGKGIEDLIALDVEGRRALGEAARQRIYSNFTMASASQRFMSLYRDILVKRKA
ncbi:glycosyltransferase [Pseudomonas aeruginosa]|uniref:glycosyltransferase family 4 protein n=1 Tax=Pseudomonas aeruginosa TaxID=287 RepID=UPI000EB3E339|nr:glycosyltransferase [Pseudomonas aeruginosa]